MESKVLEVTLGCVCIDNLGQVWRCTTRQQNWRSPEITYVLIERCPIGSDRKERYGIVNADGTRLKCEGSIASCIIRVRDTLPEGFNEPSPN